jgi:hypothetical protein
MRRSTLRWLWRFGFYRGWPGTYLDASAIQGLAAHLVKRLNALHATGTPKHLLLRGPASLAVAIGQGANSTGRTFVPFYDGHDGYVGGLWIG